MKGGGCCGPVRSTVHGQTTGRNMNVGYDFDGVMHKNVYIDRYGQGHSNDLNHKHTNGKGYNKVLTDRLIEYGLHHRSYTAYLTHRALTIMEVRGSPVNINFSNHMNNHVIAQMHLDISKGYNVYVISHNNNVSSNTFRTVLDTVFRGRLAGVIIADIQNDKFKIQALKEYKIDIFYDDSPRILEAIKQGIPSCMVIRPQIRITEIQGAGFFAVRDFLGNQLTPTYAMSYTSRNSANTILRNTQGRGITSLLDFARSTENLNRGNNRKKLSSAHIYLITEEDEIYLLHHTEGGRWRGPGGNIDGNEQPLDAMKREFKEEVFVRNNNYRKDNFDTFCDTYNHYDIDGVRLFVGVLKPDTKHLLPISVYPDY